MKRALVVTLTLACLGGCDPASGDDDAGVVPRRDARAPGEDSGGGRTDGGGTTSDEDAGTTVVDGGSEQPPEGSIPIVVAVGWQGLRMVSLDEGLTWCQTGLMVDGHDDLFRGGGYHDGLFIGAHAGRGNNGSFMVSRNGYEWTAIYETNEEPDLPPNPDGQWFGGVAYGNDLWVAVGGCGNASRSVDGYTWEPLGRQLVGCLHFRSVAFHDGLFVAGADDSNWYSSTDGEDWTLYPPGEGAGSFVVALESGLSGRAHGQQFYQGRGVCLAGRNDGILRSTAPDCSGATAVPGVSTAAQLTAFLFGHAPEADYEPDALPSELRTCLGL